MAVNPSTRICISICADNLDELLQRINRAPMTADMVEIRLDCFDVATLQDVVAKFESGAIRSSLSLIFTLRPMDQGGMRDLQFGERIEFWRSHLCPLQQDRFNYVDLEYDVARYLSSFTPDIGSVDWDRVICSHHDFRVEPENLSEIWELLADTRAGVLKIAVVASDVSDCVPILKFLDRSRNEQRKAIAIAMGDAGITTRILGPARGSFLTYASPDSDHATASGQLDANTLEKIYRVRNITDETIITGLMGRPVSHSVSPHMHNAAFAASDLDAVYIPFDVQDPSRFLARMVHPRTRQIAWNLRGLSVTAPHKIAVMKHLDRVDPAAKEIGSVNTIVVKGEALFGYNTDVAAAISLLRRYLDFEGENVAIIGLGGAARALLWGLRAEGASVTVFARDVERASTTAQEFGAACRSIDGANFDGFHAVVHATPIGTRGQSEGATLVTETQLRGAQVAFDLVYNPIETRFLSEARKAGCETIGGLEMLLVQAMLQFQLWFGTYPPTDVMEEAAMRALK